jgi:hypothetical protein
MIPRNVCLDCGGIFVTEAEYLAHAATCPHHRIRRKEEVAARES